MELEAKPDRLTELLATMREGFVDVRAYDGYVGLTAYINQEDDCNMLMAERLGEPRALC